jgi:hypothetical protein
MSADGSWSVFTHEHRQILLFSALRLLLRQSCQQMVHGVFALMNICQIAVLSMLRLLQR